VLSYLHVELGTWLTHCLVACQLSLNLLGWLLVVTMVKENGLRGGARA